MIEEREEWRAVEGYDGYEVSDLGRVKSMRREGHPKILAPGLQSKGYPSVFLSTLPMGEGRRGAQRSELVHVLVLKAFVGPCPAGMEARHEDGDRTNAHLTNLSWAPFQQAQLDQRARGTLLRGEANHISKLTWKEVRIIRAELKKGTSGLSLARRFEVSGPTISDIKHGVTWNDDPESFSKERAAERPRRPARNGEV